MFVKILNLSRSIADNRGNHLGENKKQINCLQFTSNLNSQIAQTTINDTLKTILKILISSTREHPYTKPTTLGIFPMNLPPR